MHREVKFMGRGGGGGSQGGCEQRIEAFVKINKKFFFFFLGGGGGVEGFGGQGRCNREVNFL